MERKRFLAVVMTVMMVISMIPSMVFAEVGFFIVHYKYRNKVNL